MGLLPLRIRGVRPLTIVRGHRARCPRAHAAGNQHGRRIAALDVDVSITELDVRLPLPADPLRSATPFVARYEFEELGTRPRPVTRYTLAAEVRAASAYRLLGPAFTPLLRGAVRRRLTALKFALESRPD